MVRDHGQKFRAIAGKLMFAHPMDLRHGLQTQRAAFGHFDQTTVIEDDIGRCALASREFKPLGLEGGEQALLRSTET